MEQQNATLFVRPQVDTTALGECATFLRPGAGQSVILHQQKEDGDPFGLRRATEKPRLVPENTSSRVAGEHATPSNLRSAIHAQGSQQLQSLTPVRGIAAVWVVVYHYACHSFPHTGPLFVSDTGWESLVTLLNKATVFGRRSAENLVPSTSENRNTSRLSATARLAC